MAAKKGSAPKAAGGGGLNGRIVAGAVAVAAISAASSFVAIRFALPKQIIVKEVQVVQTPAPSKDSDLSGNLWSLTDPFIVNLADPRRHFLKVNVSLMIAKPSGPAQAKSGGEGAADPSKAVIAQMTPLEPIYRDAITETLRRQTVDSLADEDRVKNEIKVALNLLNEQDPQQYPKTLAVYFSDFVIQ